jgi:hypothetical protein
MVATEEYNWTGKDTTNDLNGEEELDNHVGEIVAGGDASIDITYVADPVPAK